MANDIFTGSGRIYAGASPVGVQNDNYIILTNPTGETLYQYPLLIARPFVKGEIFGAPQFKIGNDLIITQSDTKQWYEDGSIKHAIISAVIPEIGPNSSVQLQIVNQPVLPTVGLTQQDMLASNFDFEATMHATFTNGQIGTASARTMLSQGKFKYWTKGPVSTTILLADHSAARTTDFGADAHRSVRPMFYVTFWPTLDKVQVRFVAEICNTIALQDQKYDLVLTGGLTNPQQLYQQLAVPHQGMSRWTRQFWLGTPVPNISINHNLGYISRSKLIPNYDLGRIVPEATIASRYATWTSAVKTLYGAGVWERGMPAAGGRQDLGLYPSWTARWLYTGDWRMAEIAIGQAELSGAWPMCLREGDPTATRTFDEDKKIPGIGRIVSINQGARPTLWFRQGRLTWSESAAVDKVTAVGPMVSTKWSPDVAHHPDISSAQYLLTGDYYFLEQMWFSASYTAMDNNAGAKSTPLGRGPTGSEGGMYPWESRGQGWCLRTRIHAASISPDHTPEKKYLETIITKGLELWEGLFNVDNPKAKYPAIKRFARITLAPKMFPSNAGEASPLGQWDHNSQKPVDYVDSYYDYSKASGGISPWMAHIVVLALGRAEELGYPATPLKRYAGQMLTGPATTPGFPLELLSGYRQPTIRQPDGKWFTNWNDVYDAWLDSFVSSTITARAPGSVIDAEFGYQSIILAASSYITDVPGGSTVYEFHYQRWGSREEADRTPKWSIRPRNI